MPNDLRTSLLPVKDAIEGIAGRLGLRLYTVQIKIRTWSGSRPGVDGSTAVDSTMPFFVDAGRYKPRVRQVTQREVIASGGAYSDQDLRIGPITPPYAGSGADNNDITDFDPLLSNAATEIFFLVLGPGMAPTGSWFEKISQDVTRPFHYEFVIRRTGKVT